jgi:hypothetical protein
MKARTFIITIGAALALAAPIAHASSGGNTLRCAIGSNPAVTHLGPKPFFSPLNPRGLMASTSSLVGNSCAAEKAVTTTAPNGRYQVLRNSL